MGNKSWFYFRHFMPESCLIVALVFHGWISCEIFTFMQFACHKVKETFFLILVVHVDFRQIIYCKNHLSLFILQFKIMYNFQKNLFFFKIFYFINREISAGCDAFPNLCLLSISKLLNHAHKYTQNHNYFIIIMSIFNSVLLFGVHFISYSSTKLHSLFTD